MYFALLQALPPMPAPPALPAPPFTFVDLIVVLMALLTAILTAVGIVLAGLAILIGLLAFWGYRTFEDKVREHASDAARSTVLAYVKGDEIRGVLKNEALLILSKFWEEYRESQQLSESQPPQGPSILQEEQTAKGLNKRVGEPRKKKGGPKNG